MTLVKKVGTIAATVVVAAAGVLYWSFGALLPWRETAEAERLAVVAGITRGQTVAETGLESQLVVEIRSARRRRQQSRHRAFFREFSLGQKDDTEVLTRWRSPEWICLDFVGKLLEEQDGDPAGGHPDALAGADGNGSRRADRCRPARADAGAPRAPERLPDAESLMYGGAVYGLLLVTVMFLLGEFAALWGALALHGMWMAMVLWGRTRLPFATGAVLTAVVMFLTLGALSLQGYTIGTSLREARWVLPLIFSFAVLGPALLLLESKMHPAEWRRWKDFMEDKSAWDIVRGRHIPDLRQSVPTYRSE